MLVVAAPAEARAVLAGIGAPPGDPASDVSGPWVLSDPAPGFQLLLTGVGKANAAAGVARFLNPQAHGAILNVGIGGSLPGGPALGSLVAATASIYADEGLQAPDGFTDCAALGFPLGPFAGSSVPGDPGLLQFFGPLTDLAAAVATVSTCSGTDALAGAVASRTGAVAEAMEGAAVGHVASRLGVPFIEVRSISNTTGNRGAQRWEIRSALGAITRLIGQIRAG